MTPLSIPNIYYGCGGKHFKSDRFFRNKNATNVEDKDMRVRFANPKKWKRN